MSIYDRDFVTVTNETERELKIPTMTGQDGKLFAGLTQENVEMNRQVRLEMERAMKREQELQEEMHSFGMIECTVFDSRAKIMRVHVDATRAFSCSVKSSSLTTFSFVDSTVSGALEKGHDICLFPVNFEYSDGVVSAVEASGTFWSNGKLFACDFYYDTSGDDAILRINLAGGITENGRLCVPDTNPSQVLIKMHEIDCYM